MPGTIPGEIVTIVDSEEKRDGSLIGEVGMIDVPSPHRNPNIQCPHYSDCGACSLMHVKYKHQLTVKAEEVRKAFKLSGVEVDVPRCIPSPTSHFRSTIHLVVQEGAQEDRYPNRRLEGEKFERSKNVRVGYYHKLSSLLVTPISSCLVAVPPINEVIPKIGAVLSEFRDLTALRHISIKATPDNLLILMLSLEGKKKSKRLQRRLNRKEKQKARSLQKEEAGREFPRQRGRELEGENHDWEDILEGDFEGREEVEEKDLLDRFARRLKEESSNIHAIFLKRNNLWEPLADTLPQKDFRESILGNDFVLSPGSFIQTNIPQAEKIYSRILGLVGNEDRVVDAYSGVGILSCLIAKKAKSVMGIEHQEEAVRDARLNARCNDVHHRCEFVQGPVENLLEAAFRPSVGRGNARNRSEMPSIVILNPPRTGLKEAVVECLATNMPSKIIYVSCNPYTLARDISFLLSRANYSLKIELFDMFPHTMHVEVIATLSLNN